MSGGGRGKLPRDRSLHGDTVQLCINMRCRGQFHRKFCSGRQQCRRHISRNSGVYRECLWCQAGICTQLNSNSLDRHATLAIQHGAFVVERCVHVARTQFADHLCCRRDFFGKTLRRDAGHLHIHEQCCAFNFLGRKRLQAPRVCTDFHHYPVNLGVDRRLHGRSDCFRLHRRAH